MPAVSLRLRGDRPAAQPLVEGGNCADRPQSIRHLSPAPTFSSSPSLKGRVRTDRSGAALRYGALVRSPNERRIGPRLEPLDKPGVEPCKSAPNGSGKHRRDDSR